jgi:hypothetical protein
MAPSVAETINEVATWPVEQKVLYCDILLAELTVVNRGIWSDENLDDPKRVDMLKWTNELAHRVWNLKWRLNRGDDDLAMALPSYVQSIIETQPLLSKHMPWVLDSTKRRLLRVASTSVPIDHS